MSAKKNKGSKTISIETLLKKQLGLSSLPKNLIRTTEDSLKQIFLLSGLKESDLKISKEEAVMKVFNGLLLSVFLNYCENKDKGTVIPLLGKLDIHFFLQSNKLGDNIGCSSILRFNKKVKDDLKNIFTQNNDDLNIFDKLEDDTRDILDEGLKNGGIFDDSDQPGE